jgi:hypothetical protein
VVEKSVSNAMSDPYRRDENRSNQSRSIPNLGMRPGFSELDWLDSQYVQRSGYTNFLFTRARDFPLFKTNPHISKVKLHIKKQHGKKSHHHRFGDCGDRGIDTLGQ